MRFFPFSKFFSPWVYIFPQNKSSKNTYFITHMTRIIFPRAEIHFPGNRAAVKSRLHDSRAIVVVVGAS